MLSLFEKTFVAFEGSVPSGVMLVTVVYCAFARKHGKLAYTCCFFQTTLFLLCCVCIDLWKATGMQNELQLPIPELYLF